MMDNKIEIKGSYYNDYIDVYASVALKNQNLDIDAIKEINEDIKQFVSHLEKRYANRKVK